MCYFRHYNKSSKRYPFTGLETYFLFINPFINRLIDNGLLQARPNCDQTLLHLKTIVHRLWYIRCCTQPQMLYSHCLKSMVSSFPAENKAVNIADIRCCTGCSLRRSSIPLSWLVVHFSLIRLKIIENNFLRLFAGNFLTVSLLCNFYFFKLFSIKIRSHSLKTFSSISVVCYR